MKIEFQNNFDNNNIELGIYKNLDEKIYHASYGISKHGLDLIAKSPASYRYINDNPTDDDNKALIFGGACHAYILEPDIFNEHYILSEFQDFRTKAAKEWKAANSDKRILTADDFKIIEDMKKAITNHPTASILLDLTQGFSELSAYWIDNKNDSPTYRLCRCRADFINTAHNLIIDLKTTICAGESKFIRDIVNYRYHVQAAYYLDGLKNCGLDIQQFIFIAIEKTAPYEIGIYELSPNDIQLGRQIYRRNLKIYHDCMNSGKWPSYDADIRTVQLPPWAHRIDIY